MRLQIILLLLAVGPLSAGAAPPLQSFLKEGRLPAALEAYATPADDGERFSLGLLQVLEAVQNFSLGFQQLGIRPEMASSGIPFFRIITPAPRSDDSVAVATPEKVATLFKELKAGLEQANQTLRSVGEQEFTVELILNEARLDFNGDGEVDDQETLLQAFGRLLQFRRGSESKDPVRIHFDSADAAWLEGYTEVTIGMLELLGAYDWLPVWEQCAHQLFENPEPMPVIAEVLGAEDQFDRFFDYIAAIHDMRLRLIHEAGPARARDRFLAMIQASRVCWARTLAETDDDHEWLPNPDQTGPMGATISEAQIEGWQEVLDELEAVAEGERLLPHPRFKAGLGIDVEALVQDPPEFDLVLWLQGSALVPYVREGTVSNGQRWRQLTRPFGGNFMMFALWSN